jgi:DNA-binding transcriptional ArsR family regulator
MMSVSDIARHKGVSPQAVAKRVDRFEAQGLLHSRRQGGRKLVPLAEYDRLVDETTDFTKVRGEAPPPAPSAQPLKSTDENPVLVQEQARRARYEADLKQIALKRELGEIVDIRDVEVSMTRCADILVRRIDKLPSAADEITSAVAKGGVEGVRAVLKEIARQLRQALAEGMTVVKAEADQAAAEEAGDDE